MVVSCHADTSVAQGFEPHWVGHFKSEASRIRQALAADERARDKFERNLTVIREAFETPEARRAHGLAVFSSAASGLLRSFALPVPVEHRLVVDEELYLVPLVEAMERGRECLVVLMDSHRGRIFAATPSTARLLRELDELVPKHRRASGQRVYVLMATPIDNRIITSTSEAGTLRRVHSRSCAASRGRSEAAGAGGGLYPSVPSFSLWSSGKKKDAAMRAVPLLASQHDRAGPRRHRSFRQLFLGPSHSLSGLLTFGASGRLLLGRPHLGVARQMLLDEKGREFLRDQTSHILALGERRQLTTVKHPLVCRLCPFQPALLSIAIHGTLLEKSVNQASCYPRAAGAGTGMHPRWGLALQSRASQAIVDACLRAARLSNLNSPRSNHWSRTRAGAN
jgi:hypothetical protein